MTSTARQHRRPAVARPVAVGVGVVLLVAAVVVDRAVLPERRGASHPGQGQGSTGLRLLVTDDPTPFVLDVDSGAIQPVTGLPAGGDRSTHVEPVGQDAVVVSRPDCRGSDRDAGSVVYLVRHGRTEATRLGAAMDVQSSRDGQGVWLLRRQDEAHCTLSQVGWTGGRDGRRGRCPAKPSSSRSSLPGCSSTAARPATAVTPTARWSPPTAPSAAFPWWWTASPAGTWC
jgi:hypothetical protein